ncbi:hypothetical protein A176_000611 [Myxococcus hansupus]|uniref:Lipoprotein n=1 Tax=Pseudomyxococcus hansupus TaxID=1297742 RepID=A0A0H4WLT1_9BACT|nr:DUF1579 family protein [Myxococcus hansupus]AKQ63699.1 hypothetical protein A176_000611 [Myxococcus hansupus]
MFIRPFAVVFAAMVGLLGCRGSSAKGPEGFKAGQPSVVEPPVTAESALSHAAKELVGTWTCRGSVHGPGGASPSEVTFDIKPDLDKAWLRADFAVVSGEYPYKFTAYRTFDAAAGQWGNVIVDNMGGDARSSSTDGVTWLGTSSGPMGAMNIRDTERVVSPGVMKMRGQYQMDGQDWSTGYDLDCRK